MWQYSAILNNIMTKFSGVEAIILDKDGVFNNFHKVWLRVIAYRAQKIAEISAETSEALEKIRTACIRAMGVDEDDETIDPYGPCSMPLASVRLALATTLYLIQNEANPNYTWQNAFKAVDDGIAETKRDLSVVDLSESFPGVLEKIKELADADLKLAVYTADGVDNTEASLEKFKINKLIQETQAGTLKTSTIYVDLCKRLRVKPENTIMITDSPHDLGIAKEAGAKTILVLTGITSPEMNLDSVNESADLVINSLADLSLDLISSTKKKVKA